MFQIILATKLQNNQKPEINSPKGNVEYKLQKYKNERKEKSSS